MSDVRPGYKWTEVGVMPQEWSAEPLGSLIGSLEGGVSVRSVPGDDVGVGHDDYVLKTSCIAGGAFFPGEAKCILPEDRARAHTPVRGNTVIISRMNTPDLVGEVGYVPADFDNLFLPDRLWMAQRAHRDVDMRWLAAVLSHGSAAQALKNTATGTSGSMKNISKPMLRGLVIHCPRPGEQSLIAETLGDVDVLIGGLEAMIVKKRDIKQGAMQELLTGQRRLPGFAGKSSTFSLTELGPLPSEWEVSTVGTQFRVELGKMLDENKNVGAAKPYLGNRSIRWGRADYDDLPLMRISAFELERYRLRQGDLLVCEGGEVGRAAIWQSPISECYYQKALHRLRSRATYLPALMAAYLEHWARTNFFQNYVTQTSIAHLPKEKFAAMPLPTPKPAEQRAIAAVLSDLDAEIAALDGRLAKAREIKQGMMQVLLTGEIRLI